MCLWQFDVGKVGNVRMNCVKVCVIGFLKCAAQFRSG